VVFLKQSSRKTYVYHTTTYENWISIKKDKYLIPQGSNGAGMNFKDPIREDWRNFNDFLFFSTTIDEAKNYTSYFDKKWVIIKYLLPTDMLLPDKSDCFDCETWEESAKKTKQVCVRGKLSNQYIDKIYVHR
jgi:hypothetical protein